MFILKLLQTVHIDIYIILGESLQEFEKCNDRLLHKSFVRKSVIKAAVILC